MHLPLRLLPLVALLVVAAARAEQAPAPETVPEPPPLPEEGALPESEVRIIRRGDDTIKEFRVNGRLVAAQVFPAKGKPYYLVDADGDGQLEARRSELDPDFLIPAWVLKRW